MAAAAMPPYKLHEYRKEDGSFDYDKYAEIQIAGNKRKINDVWVSEKSIAFLADHLLKRIGWPSRGLCHGTRGGYEQRWFRRYLPGCEMLGTEISNTAADYPDTIQWDFHDVKPEWIDAWDFVYSNSFDHTHSPQQCLDAWMSCVRPGGLGIIEHSRADYPDKTSTLDPFGVHLFHLPYLIAVWGANRYAVREVLKVPAGKGGSPHFLLIHKFE